MPMLTGRTTPPLGESPLDARLCAELGAELARVRESRNLTVAQVGEQLLLSTRQVKALEQVEFSAFHNATFHVNAMRKYASFAGIEPARVDAIASVLSEPDPSEVMPVSRSASAEPEPTSRVLVALLAVLVVGAVLGGGFYLLRARKLAAESAPITAVAMPTVTPPPPAAAAKALEPAVVPAAATVAPPATTEPSNSPTSPSPGSFGALRVNRGTWIFVRNADMTEVERSLADGETFELDSQPTYLAIGSVDAELQIGARKIDVSRFVANGQIRIRAGDFDALVQDASPIPAPTAAARP